MWIMQLPLQITFRHMPPSPALEARIQALAQHLERFSSQITSCHVIIDAPHQHQHRGKIYEVHIHLTLPKGELVVQREHRQRHSHEDAHVALRDAFDALKRQLEDFERERRQDVKHREAQPSGWISELYAVEGFGRIQTKDGRSLYFHKNSVIGHDFDHLNTGMEVRFVEEAGERGPQASTVKIVSHPGPVA
jgi:cold shock CspA family protein